MVSGNICQRVTNSMSVDGDVVISWLHSLALLTVATLPKAVSPMAPL